MSERTSSLPGGWYLAARMATGQVLLWTYWKGVLSLIPSLRAAFIDSVFSILGIIARADGAISQAEILVIDDFAKSIFAPSARRSREALEKVRHTANSRASLSVYASRIRRIFIFSKLLREVLLDVMISVSISDDVLAPAEEDILRKVSLALGVSGPKYFTLVARREAIQALLAKETASRERLDSGAHRKWKETSHPHFEGRSESSELLQAYQTLKCSPDTPNPELKRQYRKLAMQYHPDRVRSGHGNSAQSALIFRQVQEAYQFIKLQREGTAPQNSNTQQPTE